MSKSRNFVGNIESFDSHGTVNTEFAVTHGLLSPEGLPIVPRGYIPVRRSVAASLWASTTTSGVDSLTTGFWEFETLTADSWTNGLTLTNNNAVTQVAGHVGNAANFVRASRQFFSRADEDLLRVGNFDFGICFWGYLASKPAAQMMFYTKWDSSITAGGAQTQWDNTVDRIRFVVNDGTTSKILPANTFGAPALTTWFFVCAWHDAAGDTLNISINDGATDSVAWTTGALNTTAAMCLGEINSAHIPSGAPLDGRMDQVIWCKGSFPTAAMRTWLYNGGTGRTAAELTTGTVTPWTTTTAYFRSNVANAQFSALFFA